MSSGWNPAEYPWQKRFPKDALAGPSASMTHLQRSIYHTLLDRAWLMNGLPTDHDRLSRLAFCSRAELDEAWTWPLDEIFVQNEDGRLRNSEQEALRAEAVTLRERRVHGGKKAGRGRSATAQQKDSDSSAYAQQQECVSSGGGIKQPQPQSQPDSSEKRVGATAPAPASNRPRLNGKAELAKALEGFPGNSEWLAPILEDYRQARADAKYVVLRAKAWATVIPFLIGRGEAFTERRVTDAITGGWKRLRFPDDDANAQQTSSQGPSRGGFYRGPALKDVEARTARRNIADRYRQMTGNILLEDEDAFEMARADDDWHMHDYDWKTGRRNDAPPDKPRSGTNIDSPSTPF